MELLLGQLRVAFRHAAMREGAKKSSQQCQMLSLINLLIAIKVDYFEPTGA
jgi:hypothetical protein